MAFLQFLDGTKFFLSEPVNVISNREVPGTNTCVLDNDSIQQKHAAITRNAKGFRLIDMCSNQQTFMKEKAASRFESLEPLEFHLLRDSDFIRFGLVAATFCNPNVVESSQLQDFTNVSKFFVPDTQESESNEFLNDDVPECTEIPETEHVAPASPCRNSRGSTASSMLDVLTEHDGTSNDAKCMFSQNFFGATKKTANGDSSDDENSFHSIDVPAVQASRDGSVTPDLISDRDGSVTPDLITPKTSERQENTLKQEPESANKILQSLLDTDSDETDDERGGEEKFNPRMFDPTQPFFAPPIRTRFQQKRQADIKPKTISLTDFDFTQQLDGEPSPKKACYALETQPFMPFIPKRATGGAKVVNRILMSSDEEELLDESVTKKDEACRVTVEPCTPEKRSESPFDAATPELLPNLPSDSQFGAILEMANASQTSMNNSDTAIEEVLPVNNNVQDKENIWKPPRQETVGVQKKPRRRIMKYDSDDEAGPSTRIKVKKRPKKSCAILISNGNANLNDLAKSAIETLNGKFVERVAEADVLVTQDKLKLTAKLLASICRRIPIVGSEYLEASLRAGGWLDSKLFIIYDEELERRKQVSLKASILSSLPKIFENFSVLITSNTNVPRALLIEIIENAGGEFLDGLEQPSTRTSIAVIFNNRDKAEVKEISRKYPGIMKINDSTFVNNVLHQKL